MQTNAVGEFQLLVKLRSRRANLGAAPDSLQSAALTRLDSRYYGPARRFLIRQTRHLPRQVDFSVPIIRIVGAVRVSAHLRTATIHAIETWLVRAEPRGGRPGRVLLAERNAHRQSG